MEKVSDRKSWPISFLIIVAVASFGVYWNALSNGLIWDDPIVLERQASAFLVILSFIGIVNWEGKRRSTRKKTSKERCPKRI